MRFPRATRPGVPGKARGGRAAAAAVERARLRELERETRELKMENEFLKKAAAYVCPER